MQHQVHITLQGKGGVGKSMISSVISQYLMAKSAPARFVDTDPVNATLMGYKSLEAQRITLMPEGATSIDERKFDELMEQIVSEDASFVIDNGASSFIALSNYIIENDAIAVMIESGKKVVIHTVVTGGQAMRDTLRGFSQLASQLPEEARLIVWLNEYFGEISGKDNDGNVKHFEEMTAYLNAKDKVEAIIRIPKQSSSTFGKDMELMLDQKMTFADVAASGEFGMMAKKRLDTIRDVIFKQLDNVI
jgi:hypothetical protein